VGELTMAEHNSSLAAGYKCFGNLPFGASQEKEKKKEKTTFLPFVELYLSGTGGCMSV
jgi:hypothetical protein